MRIPYFPTADSPGQEVDLRPTKILCIGVNYRAHAAEMGKTPPDEPLLFMKPPSALLGDGGSICRPGAYDRVDYEAELAVVFGRRGRHIAVGDALDHVKGYTCLNDVSVRDLQKKDGQWIRAKGFDSFCPIGPRLVGGLDPADLAIGSRLNGQVVQDSRTSDMIFSVAELISFVSRYMTLEEGDILTTGTPSGVGNLSPGDRIEVEIEGVGVLGNSVVLAEPSPLD